VPKIEPKMSKIIKEKIIEQFLRTNGFPFKAFYLKVTKIGAFMI
jgi:hypothetical protein